MNGKTFSFTYDRAVGIFSKDLWSADTTQSASQRSAVAGYAYLPGLCNSNRYAINEEYGGFQYVTVVTHEMGHNFGANHDGAVSQTVNCPASNNNIMTAGQLPTNLQNKNLFSSCSIAAFKSTVLTNNQ